MQQNFEYGLIAKLLHWLIALLIIINFGLGLSLDKNQLFEVHKQLGLIILGLVIIRILWRVTQRYPNDLPSLTKTEKLVSSLLKYVLYILMVLVPLSGYIMVNAKGYKLSFLSFVHLPSLISPLNHNSAHQIKEVHELLAYAIILVVVLHVLAALKHHFLSRDETLRRMWFKR